MSTRRDFLAMMLGAPLAYACRGEASTPLPPGEIVDTGMARGHLVVRDGAPVAPASFQRHRVAIVGSGIAGLAAAWELRRRGVRDVVVLELDGVSGGTSRGAASAVTPYPWGAHYIVAPQRDQTDLVALLTEMSAIEGHAPDGTPIVDERLRCREPEERVWYLGTWWDGLYLDAGASADDRRQLAAFNAEIDRWSAWRDAQGRRAFAIPRSLGSDAPEVTALDRLTFAAWLDERKLTSPRLRWLCDYACRDDYALTAAQTSAWAGLFYFAGRQSAPGVDAQSVVTWPDGNGSLVRHLAHGQTIHTGVAVLDVDDLGATVRVTAVGPSGPLGIEADAVIVATPTFVANRIVRARRGAHASAAASSGSATASSGSATASSGSAATATASSGSATASSGSATASSGSATASSGPATASSGPATASSGSATASSGSATASSGSAATASSGSATASPGFVTASSGSAQGASAIVGDYGAWAVANVHLRARPIERGRGAPPSWDNVFRDSPSLGYVAATHQRGRDRGPTVWTWYYPFTDEDPAAVRKKLAGAGYAEWAETVLADLARAHPDVRRHVERIEVAFWGHGMVRPRPGTVWSDALAAHARPIGRIHFAHTDLSGYALFEEAFDHGLRAARAVAEALRA